MYDVMETLPIAAAAQAALSHNPKQQYDGHQPSPLGTKHTHRGGSASTSAHCSLVRRSRILSMISFLSSDMAVRPLPT